MSTRVALVTGSASGIGEATARRLAADGMTAAIHSRSSVAAGTALAGDLGGTYYQADLADDEAAAGLVPRVLEDHGRLDGFDVPRVSLLETEYLRAVVAAELRWLDEVIAGLADGSIAWSREQFAAVAAQWT